MAVTCRNDAFRMTETEYLAFERQSETKHEYLKGDVWAMAGASWEHNQIFGATFATLYAQLRGKDCQVNPSNQRVQVMDTGLMTYPDLSIIYGEPKFAGEEFDTLVNPVVIIEILSSSTEAYDRGAKFQHYREIDSLREYILISQNQARIEGYRKGEDGKWILTDVIGLDAEYKMVTVGCVLALSDVYENITFATDNETGDEQ